MKKISDSANGTRNKVRGEDAPIHTWYRFVLGYPPHLVRYYFNKFEIAKRHRVLDPFCGTGTTPVECVKNGIPNYGIDANPIACFASTVKTTLNLDCDDVRDTLGFILESASTTFESLGIEDPHAPGIGIATSKDTVQIGSIPELNPETEKIIPTGFISELPLKKVLILKSIIDTVEDKPVRDFFLLALANVIVSRAANIGFGPEIYRARPKPDFMALRSFSSLGQRMIHELDLYHQHTIESMILYGDSRRIDTCLPSNARGTIDCIVTSPPYPNEKDYTRSTRLESVLLGFVTNKQELRHQKEQLLRSNSRNIFVNDADGEYITSFDSIEKIADEIERKRVELNKSSGFEKMYAKIVRHYFGGMYLHLQSLKPFLSPDARLAYVVGDQMSFFRTFIPTAELLGEIAGSLDYKVREIELWRTRYSTATKMQIRENVLILENQ